MHEVALAESIVQLVEDAVRAEGCSKVGVIRLEIGRLSCVEPEALRFCFNAVARGTMAEGACLDVIPVPGQGACLECGATAPMAEPFDACPACGSLRMQVTGGNEMRVMELEVE